MMQAGKYYVGDLCYVMHDEWSEVCDLTIRGRECLDGEFNLADGRRFAMYRTQYGDGVYNDANGNRYGVDAGLIGCIRVEDIVPTKCNDIELGAVIEFIEPFETWSERGILNFGHVSINTGYEEGCEDEYDDEE